MNRYQKYIFEKLGKQNAFMFSCCYPIDDENKGNSDEYGIFDPASDTLNIKQDEDINKTQYVLLAPSFVEDYAGEYALYDGIFVSKGGQWIEIPCSDKQYRIVVDFNDRIDAIKFVFKNRITADYILKIVYTEADKEKYFAKVAIERKEALKKAAMIKVSVGINLVNIFFQPCCDEYDHTEVKLFIPKDYVTVGGPYGPVEKPSSWMMFKKYDVKPDDFFLSVDGLAFGEYSFILKQFDKKGKLLLETEHMPFNIYYVKTK